MLAALPVLYTPSFRLAPALSLGALLQILSCHVLPDFLAVRVCLMA